MILRLRFVRFILVLLAVLLPAAPAMAQLYPYAEIKNNTPYTVSGKVIYADVEDFLGISIDTCSDDSYTVAPNGTWKATSRGSCLIKEITGKVPSGTRSLHGENTGVVTYTSSGTGYARFQIEPFGDRYRIFSLDEYAKVSKTDQRKSPGFYFVNETQWPVAFSLDQYSCLYHDVIPAQDQNGKPGIMARDTGAFWFTLRMHIQPDGKNPQTDWQCAEPVVELVADVALAALSGGSSAAASAAATGAKIAAKQVAKAAVKSATKKAVSKIASNSVKQLGTYLTETGSVTLFGQFSGYEWPARCDNMPEYHITGGPQVLRNEYGETYLMPGPAFTVRKTNTCGNDMMLGSVKSASAKVDVQGFYTGTDEDDNVSSGGSGIGGTPPASNPSFSPGPFTIDGVNGRNLVRADYSGGSFRQVNQTAWNELNASGQVGFSFQETGRDDWSVYLLDTSRNVRIVLDVHRKRIGYASGGGSYSDIYEIVSAYRVGQPAPPPQPPAPPPSPSSNRPAAGNPTTTDGANGENLVLANFNGGSYRSEGGGRWTERNANGAVAFNFEETGHDEWSVYLLDRSRNVRIQLDVHRKKVRYGAGNDAMVDLYDIGAALRNGSPAPREPTASVSPVVQGQAAQPGRGPDRQIERRPDRQVERAQDRQQDRGQDRRQSRFDNGQQGNAEVNGRNLARADFSLGSYRSVGDGQWQELSKDGSVAFRFEETGRDDWSVYLLDRSRDVRIQLDVHRRKVLYGAGGGAMSDIYDISSVSAGPGRGPRN